ncbi:branched-chain amino acid transport system substrate-binding protein [Mumia flava]|uniref:Branched-chain amino acid transport system substrate-binding protein n=1 Tax=Mumia flava TaxID=1348852 RepID=A0A0B2BV93_9ACTN|nr:branched-chain amino acid ABC transporter substrate-binding protein [Mumia flava]PJJ55981.1 branched-chain amino acid transport system substrate-binding protein [Mumia flava]
MRRTIRAALVAALAGTLLACSGSPTDDDPTAMPELTRITPPDGAVTAAGDGSARCPAGTAIAYVGAETGPNAQLGIDIVNGVRVAVAEHNDANDGCQVTLRRFDTAGSPATAPAATARAIADAGVLGVVGLPFSDESQVTGTRFERAGLVHVSPSATNPLLTTNGWTTFFRGTSNDNLQAQAVASLAARLEAASVAVVSDGTDYGIGLSDAVARALGYAAQATSEETVRRLPRAPDAIRQLAVTIADERPDAVFFAGYATQAGALDRALADAGYDGVFLAPDAAMDSTYLRAAGDAADTTYFTCACVPGELYEDFADAYAEVADGADPGTYSVEAYDAATVLLAGIDAGATTRADLKDWVRDYDAPGLARHYRWDEIGELESGRVQAYAVRDGEIVPLGPLG